VRGQLGGAVALDWEAAGLACELQVPLGDGLALPPPGAGA
jgi:hypothetical protein